MFSALSLNFLTGVLQALCIGKEFGQIAYQHVLSAECNGAVAHGFDDGKRLHPDALGTECIAAALEALFHGNGGTHQ